MHDYHIIFPPSSSWWRSTSTLSVLKGAPPLLIVSRGEPPAAAPKPRLGINSCNDTVVTLPRTRVTASFTSPLLLCYLGRVLLPLSYLHCCSDGSNPHRLIFLRIRTMLTLTCSLLWSFSVRETIPWILSRHFTRIHYSLIKLADQT